MDYKYIPMMSVTCPLPSKKHPQTTQGQRSLPPTVGTTHRSRKRTYSKVIKKKKRCEGISDSDVSDLSPAITARRCSLLS